MIPPKEKKCKGTGKAIGHGCSKLSLRRTYGLCPDCFKTWLYSTQEGERVIQAYTIKGKKSVEKEKKLAIRKEKEAVKSKSDYEKRLQVIVNEIVRIIDVGKGCISCYHGRHKEWTRRKQAGHFYSVGSNPTLRFNVNNIYLQCLTCNEHLSANIIGYRKGLKRYYGATTIDLVEKLPVKYKEIHLTIEELKMAIKNANYVKRMIIKGQDFTRDQINDIIGIYN